MTDTPYTIQNHYHTGVPRLSVSYSRRIPTVQYGSEEVFVNYSEDLAADITQDQIRARADELFSTMQSFVSQKSDEIINKTAPKINVTEEVTKKSGFVNRFKK